MRLLLIKDYTYGADPRLIDQQKQLCDARGNNPLHKAVLFRNPRLIKLLLDEGIGDVSKRNTAGKLPLEMPHNDILNDLAIKAVFEEYLV